MLYPSRLLLVVSYMGKNYPLNKTVDDMYLFFCKYLRRTDAE